VQHHSCSVFSRIVAILRIILQVGVILLGANLAARLVAWLPTTARAARPPRKVRAYEAQPLHHHMYLRAICLIVAFVPFLFTHSTVSAAAAQDQQTQQAQHALLVSSKPAADAVLQSPPKSVQMWFSETLVPATSKALVVDTTNRQIDMKDSHVNESNAEEMDLSLPLLPAGTYVVVWQTQSATDGHVASGSFLFRIARPDGSVPPIPAVLPTGHVPGGGGIGVQSSTSLDGPNLLQTIATWVALLFLTFWVGGIFWETWIFPPKKHSSSGHTTATEQASQQWRKYTPYALAGILIANVGIIVGLAAELAGDWSGSISFPLLRAILFESRFGIFWWLREVVALTALLFALWQIHRLRRQQTLTKLALTEERIGAVACVPCATGLHDPYDADSTPDALLHGGPAIINVLAGIPHLPRYLIEGIRQRSWYGHIEGGLALTLVLAFALSGHAAAVSSSALWAVIGIDLLHLLANAAWIGGLLYIGVVLLPTLNRQSSHEWADMLASGLPRFSVVAITSVILLAATGSFNTTVHLTSLQQFWTTLYGRTLIVKISIFVLMIGISAYHAFLLRPRLSHALAETKTVHEDLVSVATEQVQGAAPTVPTREGDTTDANPSHLRNESTLTRKETISSHTVILGKSMERWLRLEGMLGAIVLLCVALLGAFAGSLTAPTSSNTSSQPSGPVSQTKTVNGYTITLKVTPATFGTNTFIVIVKNAQGQPETGAAVSINTTMLDMDMGTETTQLQADPKQAGTYSQQADLTMAGHWEVGVRVLPANSNTFVKATFDFSAS
jgi:putative copper export protein/methionine-rich copper-binding protein CopC